MSQEVQSVRIDNRRYAVSAIAVTGVLLGIMVLVGTEKSFLKDLQDVSFRLKIILIGVLLVCVIFAVVFQTVFRTMLWMEFGSKLVYRCALGTRSLSWQQIARVTGTKDPGGKMTLNVTLANGDKLSCRATPAECEAVQRVAAMYLKPAVGPIPMAIWYALGFIAVGTAALILGVYVDYLVVFGEWYQKMVSQVVGGRGRTMMAALPVIAPVGGVVLWAIGVRQLKQRIDANRTARGSR
jgi:hypothetical protein